jgi:hypothetical protein
LVLEFRFGSSNISESELRSQGVKLDDARPKRQSGWLKREKSVYQGSESKV